MASLRELMKKFQGACVVYDSNSPARNLVDQFLHEEIEADAMQIGLIYKDGEFYKWKEGRYLETPEIEIKTSFTSWASKFEATGFRNTRSASEEALHHIKTRTILPSSKKINKFLTYESNDHFVAFENPLFQGSCRVG